MLNLNIWIFYIFISFHGRQFIAKPTIDSDKAPTILELFKLGHGDADGVDDSGYDGGDEDSTAVSLSLEI